MASVIIRGVSYDIDNIKWAPAEPDVGIMDKYMDGFDLIDPNGKPVPPQFWDSLTPEEHGEIEDVANTVVYEPEPWPESAYEYSEPDADAVPVRGTDHG